MNSGRHIDAVNLAFAFELTEQFPPVPLLKSYLKEAKKASSTIKAGSAPHSAEVLFLFPMDIFLKNNGVNFFYYHFPISTGMPRQKFCVRLWL